MKVTLFQMDLNGTPSQNRQKAEQCIIDNTPGSDMIILPEMFTTGFSMDSERISEDSKGETYNWLKSTAIKYNCALVCSVAVKENGEFFNRLFFATPEGNVYNYDKRHCFRMAAEHEHYTNGNDQLIVEYKGIKIAFFICYDLRFPVWSRNNVNYDLAIYVANWPEVRIKAWDALLKARAIENLSYVIGVNRCGYFENLYHNGSSQAIDFKGEIIGRCDDGKEMYINVEINKDSLDQFKEKFPAYMDMDNFMIIK